MYYSKKIKKALFSGISVGALALFILFASSCNKSLDVPSTRVAGEPEHWTSLDDVRSALFGVYGLFRAALANDDAYWLWGDLREGDFTSFSRPDLTAIINDNLNASYPVIQNITDWRRFYAVINACNLFIERSDSALQDKRYTELNHKVDIAQIRSLRAFAYFFMVRIWGDVPLIVHSHEGTFIPQAKTSKDKVLAFCENELRAAAPDLPYVYGGDDPQQPGQYYGYQNSRFVNTLITKLAGYAMLAHIAAWQGHYYNVAVYTKFILDNYKKEGMFYTTIDQLTDPDGIFADRNANQLIGFNFVKGHGEATASGHIEQLTLAAPLVTKPFPDIYVTKDSISSAFPAANGNDERFGIDTLSGLPRTAYFTNYSGETPIFSKIKVINGGTQDPNFAVFTSAIIFTRLEEITLLRAEALTVLKQRGDAIQLLNIIKKNRGIEPYVEGASGDLLTEIFNERRRELMGEGWRWYDQIRYNRIKHNNPAFDNLINKGGIYWPIAQEVLNRNHLLVQNSYWTGK